MFCCFVQEPKFDGKLKDKLNEKKEVGNSKMTGIFKKGLKWKKTGLFPDFCITLCKQEWRHSSKFNKIWEGLSEVWDFLGHVCVEEQSFSAMGWPEGEN